MITGLCVSAKNLSHFLFFRLETKMYPFLSDLNKTGRISYLFMGPVARCVVIAGFN